MAEPNLDFLTKKIGPLPLGIWLLAGGGIWWYFQRNQKAATTAGGAQTDPAGNVGTIDPATGYVYGTPQDSAGLAANNAGTSSSGTSSSTNATTGAQTYADNNTWGIAAVNYLVGLGIDATTANQAIQLYLSSQPLTTAQQGDVNLAIQSLGAPPSLPGPVTSSTGSTGTTPVTTPGSGGTTTTGPGSTVNPPTPAAPTLSGGHVISVNNNDAVIGWTGTGASQWSVRLVGPGPLNGFTNTVSIPQATYSGLEAGHNYTAFVTPVVNGKPVPSAEGHVDFQTTR